MTTETKAPIEKIRDGSLEISIWANQTDKAHTTPPMGLPGATRLAKTGRKLEASQTVNYSQPQDFTS